MSKERHVVVVDATKQFVTYTSPGVARKLLKSGMARVLRKSPFVIRLGPGMTALPEIAWNARGETVETQNPNTPQTASERRKTTALAAHTTSVQARDEASKRLNARRLGYAWTEYFSANAGNGDVYVQNISDKQISLEIEIGPGVTAPELIPPTPNPINLTERFSFEALSKSANFRRALSKKRNGRPELILLDPVQVEGYYAVMAQQNQWVGMDGSPDLDKAMDEAEKARIALISIPTETKNISPSNSINFAPPKTAQELIALNLASRGIEMGPDGSFQSMRAQAGHGMMTGDQMEMRETVSPKVLDLCQQVNPQIPEGQRMKCEDFFRVLQSMSATLRLEDYQHIEAHGTYRSVKNWARQRIAEISQGEGLPDDLNIEGHSLVGQAQRRGALAPAPVQNLSQMPPAPVSLAAQGTQYQGPGGFANAPFREAHGAAESMTAQILGPNGLPMGG